MIILKAFLISTIVIFLTYILLNILIIYIKLNNKKNKIIWNMKEYDKRKEEELIYCEQCYDDMPKEHICLTCCGDEITGWVEDYGICPTCKEHI